MLSGSAPFEVWLQWRSQTEAGAHVLTVFEEFGKLGGEHVARGRLVPLDELRCRHSMGLVVVKVQRPREHCLLGQPRSA